MAEFQVYRERCSKTKISCNVAFSGMLDAVPVSSTTRCMLAFLHSLIRSAAFARSNQLPLASFALLRSPIIRSGCPSRAKLRVHLTRMSSSTSKPEVYAIEWENFAKSTDVGFARRQRFFKSDSLSSYAVQRESICIEKWRGLEALTSTLYSTDDSRPRLILVVVARKNGIFRVFIDDLKAPKHPRYTPNHVLIDNDVSLPLNDDMICLKDNSAQFAPQNSPVKVQIELKPFSLQLLTNDNEEALISLNDQQRLRLEDFTDSQGTDGIGPETFRTFTDTKPRGPESVGIDIGFPFANKLHGIPERTSAFALPDTVKADNTAISEPYRMYNLDVSFYETDSPFGLYGAVPLLIGRNNNRVAAVFWHNTSETYVDTSTPSGGGRNSHWFSESGLLDLFLLPGPKPSDVFAQYLNLTGTPVMQQRFVLGYHQCRYSYIDEKDVREVDEGFDERKIPYDVMWLDIDHTDGKRYFTWDLSKYPNPSLLQKDIAAKGRKTITIVDPHIKRDDNYPVHKLASSNGLYITNADGTTFAGKCWAGDSSYYDYTSARAREVWVTLFEPSNYVHFSRTNHIWNDMNEPSVFDGPENTINKDALHEGGIEHRHVHNVYGHQMVSATFRGIRLAHGGNSRPYILTRSFFAGTQRYATVWTGDNTADWNHLACGTRMLLALQICGIAICGSDVGGFFGNPDGELVTRWYQAAAFQPFFRGHSNTDTARREPWLFGEPYTKHISNAIRVRYEYIPLWYTLMAACCIGTKPGFSEKDIAPPMRPLWWEFSDVEDIANESQWMVGNALLIAPITKSGAKSHTVILPQSDLWYDLYHPSEPGRKLEQGGRIEMDVELDRMVVLQRGGTIVPKAQHNVRSTAEGIGKNGLTIVVAMSAEGTASGKIYIDDGESYAYKNEDFLLCEFLLADNILRAEKIGGVGDFQASDGAVIGKIVVLGSGQWTSVHVNRKPVDFVYSESKDVITVDGLKLSVAGGWEMKFEK